MMILTVLASAILVTAHPADSASSAGVERIEVGYKELSAGKPAAAIARIEASPATAKEPDALINLATANARMGQMEKAQRQLQDARASTDRYFVQLADGRWIDSRHAARIAMNNLEGRTALASR